MQSVGAAKFPKAEVEQSCYSAARRYCGDLSSCHWKYTWFIFYTKASAQYPTDGAIKEILLLAVLLLQYCCVHCFFNLMTNPFANRAPWGLDCAWEMSFWKIIFCFHQKCFNTLIFLAKFQTARGRFVYKINFMLPHRCRRSFLLSLTMTKQFTSVNIRLQKQLPHLFSTILFNDS